MTRFPLQPLLLASILLTGAAMAHAHETDGPRNRIDFQSEVSQVMPNDLMRATLSIELSDRNPGQLARALTQAMNEGLAKGRGFSTVKLASGNQQSWPVYTDKQKLEGWRGDLQSVEHRRRSSGKQLPQPTGNDHNGNSDRLRHRRYNQARQDRDQRRDSLSIWNSSDFSHTQSRQNQRD